MSGIVRPNLLAHEVKNVRLRLCQTLGELVFCISAPSASASHRGLKFWKLMIRLDGGKRSLQRAPQDFGREKFSTTAVFLSGHWKSYFFRSPILDGFPIKRRAIFISPRHPHDPK
jgi:hypothetical protein